MAVEKKIKTKDRIHFHFQDAVTLNFHFTTKRGKEKQLSVEALSHYVSPELSTAGSPLGRDLGSIHMCEIALWLPGFEDGDSLPV